MTEDLIDRITYHLSSGGLFNPELADHLAVRNLLMECREALAQRTWFGLTDEEVESLQRLAIDPVDANGWGFLNRERYANLIEAKLKEKNT